MKTLAALSLALAAALLVLPALAGADAEPESIHVTARLIRTDEEPKLDAKAEEIAGPADGFPPGGLPNASGILILTPGASSRNIGRIFDVPGQEANARRRIGPGKSPESFSLSLLRRVGYVQDYEVEVGTDGPHAGEPIRKAIAEGAVADLAASIEDGGRTVLVDVDYAIAEIGRPISTFATRVGDRELEIELPELMFQRRRARIRIPVDGTVLSMLDRDRWLVLSASREGDTHSVLLTDFEPR